MKNHNIQMLIVVTLFVLASTVFANLNESLATLILIFVALVNILMVLAEINNKIK